MNERQPSFERLPDMSFVGYQQPIDLINQDFTGVEKAWSQLLSSPQAIPHVQQAQVFWGITRGLNAKDHSFMAAQQVSRCEPLGGDLQQLILPELYVAKFEHRGSPLMLGDSMRQAMAYLAKNELSLSLNLSLERYDERCDPANLEGYIIDIYFPVIDKSTAT